MNMVSYKSQRIKIEGTEDFDVACALAVLAGFGKGTVVKYRSPGDYKGTSRTVIVFHKDTVEKDSDMFAFTQNPDILVSEFLGDEYLVEFNKGVDESLVEKIEPRIKEEYSKCKSRTQ